MLPFINLSLCAPARRREEEDTEALLYSDQTNNYVFSFFEIINRTNRRRTDDLRWMALVDAQILWLRLCKFPSQPAPAESILKWVEDHSVFADAQGAPPSQPPMEAAGPSAGTGPGKRRRRSDPVELEDGRLVYVEGASGGGGGGDDDDEDRHAPNWRGEDSESWDNQFKAYELEEYERLKSHAKQVESFHHYLRQQTFYRLDDELGADLGAYTSLLGEFNDRFEDKTLADLRPPSFNDVGQSKQTPEDMRYWNWVWANQYWDFFDEATPLPFPSPPNRSAQLSRMYVLNGWVHIERPREEFNPEALNVRRRPELTPERRAEDEEDDEADEADEGMEDDEAEGGGARKQDRPVAFNTPQRGAQRGLRPNQSPPPSPPPADAPDAEAPAAPAFADDKPEENPYKLQILHIFPKVHLRDNRHLFEFEFSENDPSNMVYGSKDANLTMKTRTIDLGVHNRFVSNTGFWKPRNMTRAAQAAVARAVAYMALTYPFCNLQGYRGRYKEIATLLDMRPEPHEERHALVTYSMYEWFNPLTLSNHTRQLVRNPKHPLGRLLLERLTGTDELRADAKEWIARQAAGH